jgi:pimeloyl-ACP methyl ester carboxylesterase
VHRDYHGRPVEVVMHNRNCIALILVFATACHRASTPAVLPEPSSLPSHTPITDGMVDVGGLSLHIHCVGEGAPIVVLDTGLGGDGSDWGEVQPQLGHFTRACVYDRAGMGYSSPPASRPHTNRQMARELHQLLQRAGLGGPYVLVGLSMGGVNVRLFASEHPDEVAGLVLVDATVDPVRSRALATDAEMAEFRAAMLKSPEGLDFDSFAAGAAEMRAVSRTIGDKPLVVLTRGKEDGRQGMSPERAAQTLRLWQELQAGLPRLSTNSAHVVARNSGHFMQTDVPELVVAAVHEVVDVARTHRRIDSTRLSALAGENPSQ